MQRTLSKEIVITGKGLHTAVVATLKIKPAQAGSGIRFVRTDLEGTPTIPALAEYVVDTARSTVLGTKEAKVSTVEHCMAALWGASVDNAIIEINGIEVPILDGSSRQWTEAIEEVGTVEQNEPRIYFDITKKLSVAIEERGSEIVAYPDNELTMDVNIDFDSKVVGLQYASLKTREEFNKNVARCRTFVFFHEILPLAQNNLIKGGDLENAIVVVESPLSEDEAQKAAEILGQKHGAITEAGYIASGGIRYENEIARHKLLDLCGDLALIGCGIRGRIIAKKPGHRINTEFAKLIRKEIKASQSLPPFNYNVNQVPVMDINDIRARLPHRPPFLLVDKIMELGESHVVGVKQVTMNEPFFVGHFPEEPVMPGVLQIEAMAQCGGILALSKVDDPENYSTYFMKIDNVKFKRKVIPGDTLLFCLELSEPIRRGIVAMHSRAFVGNELACEADLMALVTKNKK